MDRIDGIQRSAGVSKLPWSGFSPPEGLARKTAEILIEPKPGVAGVDARRMALEECPRTVSNV
jgi:hypothetical protein